MSNGYFLYPASRALSRIYLHIDLLVADAASIYTSTIYVQKVALGSIIIIAIYYCVTAQGCDTPRVCIIALARRDARRRRSYL